MASDQWSVVSKGGGKDGRREDGRKIGRREGRKDGRGEDGKAVASDQFLEVSKDEGLENFILFITNWDLWERWREGDNPCYEWVHWGF